MTYMYNTYLRHLCGVFSSSDPSFSCLFPPSFSVIHLSQICPGCMKITYIHVQLLYLTFINQGLLEFFRIIYSRGSPFQIAIYMYNQSSLSSNSHKWIALPTAALTKPLAHTNSVFTHSRKQPAPVATLFLLPEGVHLQDLQLYMYTTM